MQVTFRYDSEDLTAIAEANPAGAPSFSLAGLLTLLFASLVPLSWLLAAYGEWGALATGWVLILAGLLGIFARAWMANPATPDAEPWESTFRFLPECIEESGKDYVVRLSWQLILEVRTTERHLITIVDSTEWTAPRRFAAVIPFRAFATAEEREACVAFCRDRLEEAKSRPLDVLAPKPEVFPEVYRQTWKDDAIQIHYQHAEDDAGRFDSAGQPAPHFWTSMGEAFPPLALFALAYGWTYVAVSSDGGSGGTIYGVIAFIVAPWMALACVNAILRGMAAPQPPAVMNPHVQLILSSRGMYFRTELSEGFLPGTLLATVELNEDDPDTFLFFRSGDGNVSRVVPTTAFASVEQMRHFVSSVAAVRENIVLAEEVNRVPPSDNPYRPPESQ